MGGMWECVERVTAGLGSMCEGTGWVGERVMKEVGMRRVWMDGTRRRV